MKIVESEDKERVQLIRKLLAQKNGYCPCAIQEVPETVCPCLAFRQQSTGYCHCGLYKKVED